MRTGIAVATASVALAGCGPTTSGSPDDDCTSRYIHVARGHNWAGLQKAMEGDTRWGHVASVRTQARGSDLDTGARPRRSVRVVRVVDLLNRHGKRVVQADVWRTPDGGWRAGVWSQCID